MEKGSKSHTLTPLPETISSFFALNSAKFKGDTVISDVSKLALFQPFVMWFEKNQTLV